LDGLLGYKSKDAFNNLSFLVNLPRGRFLIVGVELWRGGGAIDEDAISFRAYKQSGDSYVVVAHTEDLRSSDEENPFLVGLCAKPLPFAPAVGEFWFVAMADVPPRAPYTVALRLFAFDGEKFRTVWAPEDIMAQCVHSAVQLTTGGFVVNKLVAKPGDSTSSIHTILHEQYTLSPGGPQEVASWETWIE
jgi:hypothetical protein